MPSSLNGTGITFSNATTLSSAPVTSVATGNGLSGGTITTTGTLTLAAPGFNTVGSHVMGVIVLFTAIASNASVAAGSANGQLMSGSPSINIKTNNLSGTWRNMSGTCPACICGIVYFGVFVRVA